MVRLRDILLAALLARSRNERQPDQVARAGRMGRAREATPCWRRRSRSCSLGLNQLDRREPKSSIQRAPISSLGNAPDSGSVTAGHCCRPMRFPDIDSCRSLLRLRLGIGRKAMAGRLRNDGVAVLDRVKRDLHRNRGRICRQNL